MSSFKIRTQDVTDIVARTANGNLWGEHPEHSKESWRDEVANDDTILGYWEWVLHQIEMQEDED